MVIADRSLPGMNGLEFTEITRRTHPEMPILMLTAHAFQQQRNEGLQCGVDDYLTKPFDAQELLLRIKALLRRSGCMDVLTFGPYLMDLQSQTVTLHQKPLDFTPLEFQVLRFFALHPGRAFTREELFEKLWGEESDALLRSVNTKVSDLRRKMQDGRWIQTVWGVGY